MLVLAGCLAGCGADPGYEVAPVQGVVTVEGEPLPGGRLMFAPAATSGSLNSGKPGFADIQPDGSYEVSTYGNGDGAVVAEHWVSIINTEPESIDRPLRGAKRVMVPRRKSVVAGQENVIPIDLTSEEVKKYGERGD